jgi:hypothetical protein
MFQLKFRMFKKKQNAFLIKNNQIKKEINLFKRTTSTLVKIL